MAVGVSVKGKQVLVTLPTGSQNFYCHLDNANAIAPLYRGYIGIELQSSGIWYQFDGREIWYGGVWFQSDIGLYLPIRLTAQWQVDGVGWTANSA